jgi:predicted metalloprotease with PDZ domain
VTAYPCWRRAAWWIIKGGIDMLAALLAAVALTAPDFGVAPFSLPPSDKPPLTHPGAPRPGPGATPPPVRRVYVVGIRFQNRGGAQGIALEQVVDGSPADRAGFTVGIIIVEIEGKSTAGRTGEDCTRLVQEAGEKVAFKYYDPVTFKLRTCTVVKAWIVPPVN